ncbi:hypothetical protein V9T40_002335 [Parthenolecanium corni]|uniref:Myosin light chain kinase, smooth muscle n=1 Tax=Parthenolecanium corni TaxID=536013 RepID=A0AAN9TG31_9HEMI
MYSDRHLSPSMKTDLDASIDETNYILCLVSGFTAILDLCHQFACECNITNYLLDYYRDYDEFKISTSDLDPFLYRLEIPRVKFDHTGAYTIIAKNEVGEAKAIVSLQVYTKETIKAIGMNCEKTKYSQVEKIPKIKRHLTDVKCCDGDSVTFEFEVDTEGDSSDIDFHWYKNGKLIPLGEDFESNVRGSVASFVIKQVYPEDEGQYSCIVTNNLGTATSTACLIVNVAEEKENIIHRQMSRPSRTRSRSTTPVPFHRSIFPKENIMPEKYHSKRAAPKFYTVPHNKVAEIGDTVRFQCSVTGDPPPSTSWDKNNVPISSSDHILVQEQNDLRILEISNVSHDDEGLYRIVVENDYGQVVATVRLDIISHRNRQRTGVANRSYEKHFGRHPIGKVANADGTCAISCNIPNSSTNSSATWYKNGEALNGKENIISKHCDSGFQLHFNNLSMDDSGVYTCILENCGGKTRCSAELIVLENNNSKNMDLQPPVFLSGLSRKAFVNEGKCFQFRVKLQGAFPMYVTWYKNDEKLPECNDFQYIDHGHGEFSLKLNDTFLADSGLYKCEACNCHGDAVSVGHLIVSDATECCDNTFAEKSSLVNGQIDMACQENGIKKVAKEQDSDSEVFDNKIVNKISINGNNSCGTNSSYCNGNLSPATILEGPGDLTVLRGGGASLKVVFFGNPEPSVRWIKGGRVLSQSNRISVCSNGGESVLKINQINADDGGKYEVIVQNSLGTDVHCISLAVEGSPDPPNGQPNAVAGDRSATVTWCSSPYDGGCKITSYTIEMRSYSNSQWRRVMENCHSLFCTIRGLQPGESYIFRIRAENVHGLSKPSAESVPTYITHADVTSPVEKKKVNIQHGELFTNQYEVLEELGKGRYGIVHKTQDKEFGNFYAAKFVRCIKSKDKDKVREEITIMNALKHPKLLQLIAAYENPKEIIMVTEYISGGELFERVVADDFTLTERDCILFMRQICEGVAYIHKNNVVHLDLKPENIMCVSRTSHQIKLIDFGLAQKISPDTPVRVLFGTPEFIPPEIINYEPIGTESDMWSVGVICYVLLSGLSPFMGENDAETFANITRSDFDFDDEAFEAISKDAKDFISSLLIKRKEKRLTAKQCLHHKWLAQHDKTMSCVKLCTDKLKKFIIRRKWQKTGNAIRALGRMATLSAASRRNSSTNSSSSSSPRVSLSGAYSSRMSSLGEDNSLLSEVSCRNSNPTPDNSEKVLNHLNSHPPSHPDSSNNSQILRSPKASRKSVVFQETNGAISSREDSLEDDDIKNNNRLSSSNKLNSSLSKSCCDIVEKEQSSLSSSCSTSRLLSSVISKISSESPETRLRDKLVLTDTISSPRSQNTSTINVKSSLSRQSDKESQSITSSDKVFERISPSRKVSQRIPSSDNSSERKSPSPRISERIRASDKASERLSPPHKVPDRIATTDKASERLSPSHKVSERITTSDKPSERLAPSHTVSENRLSKLGRDLPKGLASDCTNTNNASSNNSGLKTESSVSNLRTKVPEKTNIPSKLSDAAKIKTSERLKKFEQLSNISSNCTPKMKKETLASNKSNFQKAVAFWNRE